MSLSRHLSALVPLISKRQLFVAVDSLAKREQTIGTQVFHAVIVSEVVEQFPIWGNRWILVSFVKVKVVGFKV